MRTITKTWWTHFEFPHSGHEVMAEWKQMWHDLTFWQSVAVIVGVFVFLFLLTAIWLQPYLLADPSVQPYFSSPWQRGWPYPMW